MKQHFSNWPPNISEEQERALLNEALFWAKSNGLLMRAPQGTTAIHAPFALYPSPFPRSAFNLARTLQPIFNKLYHLVSQDSQFLNYVFEKLGSADNFSSRLFGIWRQVGSSQTYPVQKITLGIHRSDYMLHFENDDNVSLQQVEFNTISASFGCLSTVVGELHRHLAKRNLFCNDADTQSLDITEDNLPVSASAYGIAAGLTKAFDLYGVKDATIVMVVQPNERNIYDQRRIETLLQEKHGIGMIRKTLAEMAEQATINHEGRLMIDGKEVAIVYFRAGYTPNDYHSELEWEARYKIETSYAIKCPTISYQLAGSKKVQQVLTERQVLEKFLSNDEINELLKCFTGMFPLDQSDQGRRAYEMALENPEKYVLKPQREGGGNNFFGEDIVVQLESLSEAERAAFILMERISPPPYRNKLVKEEKATALDVVCELGIYGVWISDGETIVENSSIGHLLRTKGSTTNEGGVAAGFAVLDTPLLY